MTIDEAVQEIINLANNLQIIQSTPTGQAVLIAIKSLKAWGKVEEEIKVIRDRECLENDSFDEYSEGRYDVTCECLRTIYKHLSELGVKDVRNME